MVLIWSVRGSPNGTIGDFVIGAIGCHWYLLVTIETRTVSAANDASGTIGRANEVGTTGKK